MADSSVYQTEEASKKPYELHRGDCLPVMRAMMDNSIDAIVTDPPYGLSFMGAKWDYDVPSVEVWAECLRVLKPGGYLLAFGGTRTYHRLATRIEDAGFTMHPMMAWIFGSGFPKATKVDLPGMEEWRYGLQSMKPALEPIAFAQKPFSEKTGTANIKHWGTGALNIGGCRVPTDEALRVGAGGLLSHVRDGKPYPNGRAGEASAERNYTDNGGTNFAMKPGPRGGDVAGRWPANIAHDGSDEVLAAFPDAAGQQGDLNGQSEMRKSRGIFGDMPAARYHTARREDDKSAARFFYCAKASKIDRDEGLDAFDAVERANGNKWTDQDYRVANGERATGRESGPRKNVHPTVKPTDLMAYYVRLVTPPGGTVLDPYMGSGSTGKACMREGFEFVGIDKDEDANGKPLGYLEIAEARISFELARAVAAKTPPPPPPQMRLFAEDPYQRPAIEAQS